jgi:FkbM family methyltransferase
MQRAIGTFIRRTLRKFGVDVLRSSALASLKSDRRIAAGVAFVLSRPEQHAHQLLSLLDHSTAQLRQDLFVLSETDFKKNGYFVEFGATNGVALSNTLLLEKDFGWNGILAEPASCWHEALRRNRSVNIDTSCVWRESNLMLEFNEADSAELSTIHLYSDADRHKEERSRGRRYKVATISLVDLLEKFGAPRKIDYLSIDTEGSEFEILSNFDFDKYEFKIITCEHNFSAKRQEIYELLTRRGYVRTMEEYSRWDDWYIKK